jgi:prolyl-tRNA synthetase
MPKHKMAKVVLYWGNEHLIIALIRGDLEVNEVKLANVLKCPYLRLATDAEIEEAGLVAGYVSPMGADGVQVVVDETIPSSVNLVSGANRAGFHVKNVNCGRDFQPDLVVDIAVAQAGGRCLQCGGSLELRRCFEVGNIFRLGTKYSQALGATYLDEKGEEHPIIMGSYGIGTGRLMASIIEVHNDDQGIVWPTSVAPYQCHLVALGLDNPEVSALAEGAYDELRDRGYEVLFDDREERAGVKFNDADLIGTPLRITVSERNMREGKVELKLRWEKQAEKVERSALLEAAERLLGIPGTGHDRS